MRRAYWHQFQVLTKRAGRLAKISRLVGLATKRLDGSERRRSTEEFPN